MTAHILSEALPGLKLPKAIVFGGGARLAGPASVYFGLGQFHLGGVALFAPVEECLRFALPCRSLSAALAASPNINELLLCGQSFGVTVSRSLAIQLATCGLSVRGVVAMDPRCVDLTALQVITAVPRSLAQSLAAPCWRLEVLEVEFVAPLRPRGALEGRAFMQLGRGLSASWDFQLSTHCASYFPDADHYSISDMHAWDMSHCIRRQSHRSARRRRLQRVC